MISRLRLDSVPRRSPCGAPCYSTVIQASLAIPVLERVVRARPSLALITHDGFLSNRIVYKKRGLNIIGRAPLRLGNDDITAFQMKCRV